MRKLLLTLTLALFGLLSSAHAQQQVPIVAGVVTVNTSQANYFKVYVTSAITSVVLTPSPNLPRQITVIFSQDATGHAVTFSQCTVSTSANAVTACPLLYDATVNSWVSAAPPSSLTGAAGGALSGTYPNPGLSSTYALPSGTDTGAVNAYVVTTTPTISSLAYGASFTFTTANANTGASTMNVDGLGVKSIRAIGSFAALSGGEIPANTTIQLTYDGTEWVLPLLAAGNQTNAGGSLNLAGSYIVPTGSQGNGASGGINLLTLPGGVLAQDRKMLNFVCVGNGSGCNGSYASIGLDHDSVGLLSGTVNSWGATTNWEVFGQTSAFTQGTGDNFVIQQNNTPVAGAQAIKVKQPIGGSNAEIFGVDATDGSIASNSLTASEMLCSDASTPPKIVSSALTVNVLLKGGASGGCPVAGSVTDTGTVVSVPELAISNSHLFFSNPALIAADSSHTFGVPFKSGALINIGGTFTSSGCSATSLTGGQVTGSFVSGTTGTCTITITTGTYNGASIVAAPHGWSCWVNDLSTPTDVQHQTATTTTTFTFSGTTVSGDVINFGCMGY